MQQISVKIATAIALSSALLLTACGGNSDSSGAKSKVDTLVGYWKAECDTNYKGTSKNSTRSSYDYIQFVKHGKNGLKIKQTVVEEFTTNNCTGKSTLDKDEDNHIVTQKELDEVTLQGSNKFIINKDKYSRLQPKKFPVVK
ncbi:MAG: hypothetical protein KGV51_03525 [Moraxellaceae bacterium]|nr:hypothetical protein [Moraxellaceae bacterium]